MRDASQASTEARKSFLRQAFIQRDDLIGARWWFEGMQSASSFAPTRRSALRFLVGMGGILGTGLLLRAACNAASDGPGITMEALELQRKEGWEVGAHGAPLYFKDSVAADAAGGTDFVAGLRALGRDLAPGRAALDPYFVPTLFEAVNNPRAAGLTAVIRPMHDLDMDDARQAAEGLAAMFGNAEDAKQTALVLDLPGPQSVAAAAGVARGFTPVFLYDNWPHPLGVVASHQVLAAALYHRPELLAARAAREAPSPPAFVLDSDRLSPYRDDSDRFDNRYLARLPSADGLASLGVQRLLYVTLRAQAHELDDLNDDFVAFEGKGIDVKMVALADFGPASTEALTDNGLPVTDRTYYYGGHPHGAFVFWSSHHWYSPSTTGRRFTGSLTRPVSSGGSFSPAPRPTMFSSRSFGGLPGVGKQKPSGFGRVSYRSGSGTLGRSGSFGRSGSSGG